MNGRPGLRRAQALGYSTTDGTREQYSIHLRTHAMVQRISVPTKKVAVRGLCNAYHDALDCSNPSASAKPCEKVQQTFCNRIEEALVDHEVLSCEVDEDCGQVLRGTSCGCTRNWVANLNADSTDFYNLLNLHWSTNCPNLFISTCDCPPADGFACVQGQCTWNYTPQP